MIRASYTGKPHRWHGAIKFGDATAWACPHTHRNRDQGSDHAGRSAMECSRGALREARCIVAGVRSFVAFAMARGTRAA